MKKLLWLDVETTGLDPAMNSLLEVAMVLTQFNTRFDPIGVSATTVFRVPQGLQIEHVHPDVLAMHAKNGLWNECRAAQDELTAWNDLGSVIENWDIEPEDDILLAGRSVHFDRKWLDAKAPLWFREGLNLSHRIFDLTSIKKFAELCGREFSEESEPDVHRALPDVEADIELARTLVWDFGEAYFRYESVSK